MSETKHTPGPWVLYADTPSTDPNWHIITTESRMRVLANVHIEPGNMVDEANARLIVAAPEVMEALLAACSVLRAFSIVTPADGWAAREINAALSLADPAIAKAEGGK